MSFFNVLGCLCHHKTSLNDVVQDFILKFNAKQSNIDDIVLETVDLIQQLIASFNGKRVKARLIAKVNFTHLNPVINDETNRYYHFPSYQAEKLEDVEDFVVRHMTKIARRIDAFNHEGSNLVIKNIEHIHIQLTVLGKATTNFQRKLCHGKGKS